MGLPPTLEPAPPLPPYLAKKEAFQNMLGKKSDRNKRIPFPSATVQYHNNGLGLYTRKADSRPPALSNIWKSFTGKGIVMSLHSTNPRRLFPNLRFRWLGFIGCPWYLLGEDGSIWSKLKQKGGVGDAWRKLKRHQIPGGYWAVSLLNEEKKLWSFKISVLLLKAFVGPRPKGYHACHRNDIKWDDRLENLYWGSPAENVQDAIRNGRMKPLQGEKAPGVKFTDKFALEVLTFLKNGGTRPEAVIKFNMSLKDVNNMSRGWKHLNPLTPEDMVRLERQGRFGPKASRGENNGMSIFTNEFVAEVLNYLKSGHSRQEASAKYNLSNKILHRLSRGWRHVNPLTKEDIKRLARQGYSGV